MEKFKYFGPAVTKHFGGSVQKCRILVRKPEGKRAL
jgi:hypothetical protein